MKSATKSRLTIGILGSAAVLTLLSCSLLNQAVNSAVNKALGQQAVAASQLWADVPSFPGASRANIDLPPAVNLMVQGFLNGIFSQTQGQGSTKLASLSFVAFTTSKSPDDVGSFYSLDRMTNAGWNSNQQPGCGTAETGTPVAAGGLAGTFCLFGKTLGQNATGLGIIAVADKQSGLTQIYYIRAEGTNTPGTPSP